MFGERPVRGEKMAVVGIEGKNHGAVGSLAVALEQDILVIIKWHVPHDAGFKLVNAPGNPQQP